MMYVSCLENRYFVLHSQLVVSEEERLTRWFHKIRGREIELVLRHLRAHMPNGRLLDIGCGDGFQTFRLGDTYRVVGSDYRADSIDPRYADEVPFLACDSENLPFGDKAFDLVFSSNVLEHLEDIAGSLMEMRRVLRSGGFLVHTVPNATWKIIQLLFWYPHMISKLIRTRGEIIRSVFQGESNENSKVVFDSNVKQSKPGGWKALVRRTLPPRHGAALTHWEELDRFRLGSWRALFASKGFFVVEEVTLPFYSAYSFGFDGLRKWGERFGLSSSQAFIMKAINLEEKKF